MSFVAAAGVGGIAGALGGGVAMLVLAPLNAANNFLGSYYFGYGMIAGERKMYQDEWPKIKARLDKGESFITVWEEFITKDTSAVMANAKTIVDAVAKEWNSIVNGYLSSIPNTVLKSLGLQTGQFSGLPDIESRFKDDERLQGPERDKRKVVKTPIVKVVHKAPKSEDNKDAREVFSKYFQKKQELFKTYTSRIVALTDRKFSTYLTPQQLRRATSALKQKHQNYQVRYGSLNKSILAFNKFLKLSSRNTRNTQIKFDVKNTKNLILKPMGSY